MDQKSQKRALRHGSDNFGNNDGFRPADLLMALALLTRLPLPAPRFDPARPAASAAWAYPIVGLVTGGLVVLTIAIAIGLGLPAPLAAFIGLALGIVITGAMHEDGLADCVDGFWGGWTTARRLEIMKDSQIGTYGVLALLLSVGIRWQAIVLLIHADSLLALIWVEVISRAAMVWVMYRLPHARKTGLSHQTGRPEAAHCGMAMAIGAVAALLAPGTLTLTLGTIAATLLMIRLARSKIGGQTGDVLGAAQQVVAVTALCIVAA